MAEPDIEKLLDELGRKILKGNSQMFPPKEGRNQDDRKIEAIAKNIEAFTKGERSHQKDMLKILQKSFKDMGLSNDIKKIEDAITASDQPAALEKIASRLNIIGATEYKNKQELDDELEKLSKIAEDAGLNLKELGVATTYDTKTKTYSVKERSKVTAKIVKQATDTATAFSNVQRELERYQERTAFAKDMLGKFGGVVKNITKDFFRLAEGEQRYAMQTATADAGWIEGITSMGVSQLDYMKTLKATRVENLAMSAAGVSFRDSLVESQHSLIGFTANTTEAMQVAASFHKNMARIGVSQDGLGDAVSQQSKIYKENYRVLGYTAEEFSKLSEDLINDQGMRSTLLGLKEKERKSYVLGIQKRMAEYQTMGYTIERAKELQKTFQSLNQMNPKERMKQAAKTRAMMGSMGMGKEGEELFNLQTQYRTMTADQKIVADKRMAEIQSQAAGKFGEMSGSGVGMGQAMTMQMMADKTGFTQIAEKFETVSGEGLKVGDEQLAIMKERAKHENEVDGKIVAALTAADAYRAAANSALGSLVTNSFVMITALTANLIGSLAGGAFARRGMGKGPFSNDTKPKGGGGGKPGRGRGDSELKKDATAKAKAERKATSKAERKAAWDGKPKSPKGGAAATTAVAGTQSTSRALMNTTSPAVVKEGTKLTAVKQGTEVGKSTGNQLAKIAPKGSDLATKSVMKGTGKTLTKGLGKASIKSAIKKIPGIGLLASVGFSAQRAMKGDWLGAGLELVSGAASMLPLLGTAASLGLDATLMGMDAARINKANPIDAAVQDKEAAPPTKEKTSTVQEKEDKKQDILSLDQLMATLKSIDEYIREVGMVNMESVKSLNKVGTAISDANRMDKLPGH